MNKKAFFTDFVSDILGWATYTLIFILFFMLFTVRFTGCFKFGDQRSEFNLVGKYDHLLNKEQILLNYLKTDVKVDGEQINIAQLIAKSVHEQDYKELQDITKNTLGKLNLFGEKTCYHLRIVQFKSHLKTIKTCDAYIDIPIEGGVKIPLSYSDPTKEVTVYLLYYTEYTGKEGEGE